MSENENSIEEFHFWKEFNIFCDFEKTLLPLCYCSSKMEVEHKEILRKRREAISTDLEPSRVLNRLTVLDEEDRDEIKAEKTRTARVWVLLDMLPRRGSDAFKDFVCALYETKGQEHLAKLLSKDSGIEIPSSSKGENFLSRT